MVDGLHDVASLRFVECGFFGRIAEQRAVLWLKFVAANALQVGYEAFVNHVLHDFARRVERAGLLAGRGLCLRIVGCQ